jgi:acetyl-CoA synthetase
MLAWSGRQSPFQYQGFDNAQKTFHCMCKYQWRKSTMSNLSVSRLETFASPESVTPERYQELHQQAKLAPEHFWRTQGERLQWYRPFTQVKDCSFAREDFRIRWYSDGLLNVSVNCLDRHLESHGDTVALYCVGDEPHDIRAITYAELHISVCKLANVLRDFGVCKGDRVLIYLSMREQAAVAMLACTRIGAVHSVVFGGFSAQSIADRIGDCGAKIVISASGAKRGGKFIALKATVEEALQQPQTACVESVLLFDHLQLQPRLSVRQYWLEALLALAPNACEPEMMQAEDPLFILYTSGSTGKPKGVLHTTAGYLVYASFTHRVVFDLRESDVFWCTADVGWITGHSYVVYGPLCNASTSVMFEGTPNYPNASRFWQIVDQLQVSIFYTAPTAIRALMREGDAPVLAHQRTSLRLLGTVGEPINPAAWDWYFDIVGESRCPIVDTWWQTETGGILMTPLPAVHAPKPGSAMQPLFGIYPKLLDADGVEVIGPGNGNLVLTDSWPGQMRTVYGDHARFFDTYFATYPGCYFTGDGARRDPDGDFWITGRVDDVINVSGHRIGTAEVESALVADTLVAEAAAVAISHAIKGQAIYAFVTLKAGVVASADVNHACLQTVRRQIGAIAVPERIQFAPALPKTRSGKIMRRILRKIAEADATEPTENLLASLGDIQTLADPSVVVALIEGRFDGALRKSIEPN